MADETLYFEDFPPGETVRFPETYTMSAEEIVAFASEFDPQPMHLSEEGGRASILGGMAASGWHTCAVAMRLISDGYISRSAGAGAPGIKEGKWLKPVRPGDTLRLSRECLSARESASRPGIGLCTFRWVVWNQKSEPVLELVGTQMFVTRGRADAEVRL